MDFELVLLRNSNFCQKLTNVVTLIALELNHFTILRVLDHSAVTGKLLETSAMKTKRWSEKRTTAVSS
jgi:hypothetical protein